MPIRVPVTRSSLLGQSKHSTGCYLITLDPHQPSPSSASPSPLISSSLPLLSLLLSTSLSLSLPDVPSLSLYPSFSFATFIFFPPFFIPLLTPLLTRTTHTYLSLSFHHPKGSMTNFTSLNPSFPPSFSSSLLLSFLNLTLPPFASEISHPPSSIFPPSLLPFTSSVSILHFLSQ